MEACSSSHYWAREITKLGHDVWVGLTPLNKSSGGKERLGRISKMGNQYLRKLLVTGMTSRVRAAKYYPERVDPWTASILDKKPTRLATVAMVNKTAPKADIRTSDQKSSI